MKKLIISNHFKVLSLVFALSFIAFSGNAQYRDDVNKGNVLKVGETLKFKEILKSSDYMYIFCRSGILDRNGKSVWAFKFEEENVRPDYLKLDEKGSLVYYDTAGKVIWSSASDYPNVSGLRIQDDGNLVIYDNSSEPIWSLKDFKTGKYDTNDGNGFFYRYTGPQPDPSRNSTKRKQVEVNLDDLDKKN